MRHTKHKKGLKLALVVELEKLNFTYISTKIAKAGPGFDDWSEHPPVLISSSSTIHKKRPKVCTCCRVSEAKFYF